MGENYRKGDMIMRKEMKFGLLLFAIYNELNRFVETSNAAVCFGAGLCFGLGLCLLLIGMVSEEKYAALKSFKATMFKQAEK